MLTDVQLNKDWKGTLIHCMEKHHWKNKTQRNLNVLFVLPFLGQIRREQIIKNLYIENVTCTIIQFLKAIFFQENPKKYMQKNFTLTTLKKRKKSSTLVTKVQILWGGHKIWKKNLPLFFLLLGNLKTKWRIFSNL